MTKYRVTLNTNLSVVVTIDAADGDEAADRAWDEAQEYAQTVYGDNRNVTAFADFDGIGADNVTEVNE